jgi:hypothetical protein
MCELTETQTLKLVCFARYKANDIKEAFPDFPPPSRITGRRKFYDKGAIECFIAKHGNISGKITLVGWKMPSRMALDFVKGYYS